MYFVYVIMDEEGKLYIGYTSRLKRRIEEHNRDKRWELVYCEAFRSEFDAREREKKLKQYGSAWEGLKKRIRESLKATERLFY